MKNIRVLIGLAVWSAGPFRDPAAAEPQRNNVDKVDLARYLDLAEFYVAPPAAKRDAVTGFNVAGQNETALIERLTELNGRKIAAHVL